MAFRGAGTLLTEFNAAYVHPGLMPGYQGHVPSVAFSFGSPYGTATLKYFQDQRNAALEKSHTPFSRGGHFPTLFSSNPDLVLSKRAHIRDRWLHTPVYTRFNLDSDRSAQLMGFYQTAQQHRKYYLDKTGMVPQVPYFVLPVKEWERYPLPTDLLRQELRSGPKGPTVQGVTVTQQGVGVWAAS
uniref:Ciliary microtubule inner protein 2C n=1 Tax=Ursus americanus TaxID=9643 RepID=A0A452RP42_URSAM